MPAGLTFSQSSLQDYADCPRRFQLRYLEELSYPAVEAGAPDELETLQQQGRAFHRLAQQLTLGLPEDALTRTIHEPGMQRWWQAFLELYRGELLAAGELHPEISLSAPLGGARLLAKYDLLAVTADGQLRIYDWKTYRSRPRDGWLEARWQTCVYRALLVQAGAHFQSGKPVAPEQVEMVYWFANFPDQPERLPYTRARFERDWATLEAVTAEIDDAAGSPDASARFPLTEDQARCAYCPYRSYCARGREAGALEYAEAELEQAGPFDLDFDQIGEVAF